jgi:nicotinamidase-related amidase
MSMTERLTARQGALLVVDLQEKLLARMEDRARVIGNAVRLLRAAEALHLPAWATEQYPEGLGPSVPEIAAIIADRPSKSTFHCCAVPQFLEKLYGRNVRHVTVCGIETHVCVAQTAIELLRLGFRVQVAADAVASRHKLDRDVSLRRLEQAGAVISTTEAVLFEWVERADRPEFKLISELVKSYEPQRVGEVF